MTQLMSRQDQFYKVQNVLVDALGVDPEEVTYHAILTSDLGAESIDFLDINFRLEKAFGFRNENRPSDIVSDLIIVRDLEEYVAAQTNQPFRYKCRILPANYKINNFTGRGVEITPVDRKTLPRAIIQTELGMKQGMEVPERNVGNYSREATQYSQFFVNPKENPEASARYLCELLGREIIN